MRFITATGDWSHQFDLNNLAKGERLVRTSSSFRTR
jgi:hypothetical protein